MRIDRRLFLGSAAAAGVGLLAAPHVAVARAMTERTSERGGVGSGGGGGGGGLTGSIKVMSVGTNVVTPGISPRAVSTSASRTA